MKILLIDGLNFIYKGNINFKSSGKTANKTNYALVFNFFRNLRALIEVLQPDKAFFVLEGRPQFRYDLYPNYKANRIIKYGSLSAAEKQKDFNRQANEIIRLLSNLPIMQVKANDYEADDTIATLVENLKDEDLTIVSGDSDFIQLLQKNYSNLKIYHPIKKEYLRVPDYYYLVWKSLRGDISDNIGGLVGDKVALNLVSNPILLKAFLEKQENLAGFNLNRQLIELKSFDYNLLKFEEYDINYNFLKKEFSRLEMPSLITDSYWDRFVRTFKSLE